MNLKEVRPFNVSEIFNIQENKEYVIPKFQREYTWGIKEWDLLLRDILENEEGYFLGSYICICNSALGSAQLQLIDGQQRFTSISLLLLAIYSRLLSIRGHCELDEDELTTFNNLKRQIVNKTITREAGQKTTLFSPKIILQSQNQNNADYRSLLYENKLIDAADLTLFRGNRRIYKAFRQFQKRIAEHVAERQNEDTHLTEVEVLVQLYEKINATVLVGIEVSSAKDAYMLFESLNNRGIPLTAIDLIKNLLIATAQPNEAICYEQWKKAISDMGDDYAVQERFFRQYYNAFRSELNAPFQKEGTSKTYPLGLLATRSTLLDIYEKLIKADYRRFIANLQKEAAVYSVIINKSDAAVPYRNELKDLERIQGAPSHLLLLYLLTRKDALRLSDKNLGAIIRSLVTFFVRRNITDFPSTRHLNKIFMGIVSVVREGVERGDAIVAAVLRELMAVSAPDEQFVKKLCGPVYDENYAATRFILCSVEARHQTREIYSDFWKTDSGGKYVWTVEHIFPEGENIPRAWVDMIAAGDKQTAEAYREQFVHTLGNLTLTAYNPTLGNMDFLRKRDRRSGTVFVGYKNGLFLNDDVMSEDSWTVEKIQARTEKIVALALDLFKWA